MAFHLTQNKIPVLAVAEKTPTSSGPTSRTHTLTLFCCRSSLNFLLSLGMSDWSPGSFVLAVSSAANKLIVYSQDFLLFFCKSCLKCHFISEAFLDNSI